MSTNVQIQQTYKGKIYDLSKFRAKVVSAWIPETRTRGWTVMIQPERGKRYNLPLADGETLFFTEDKTEAKKKCEEQNEFFKSLIHKSHEHE